MHIQIYIFKSFLRFRLNVIKKIEKFIYHKKLILENITIHTIGADLYLGHVTFTEENKCDSRE